MNLGGDGPFQEWNMPKGWEWLVIISIPFILVFLCGFIDWLIK